MSSRAEGLSVTLDAVLPKYDVVERHERRVDLAVDQVWPHAVAVQVSEIRLLRPLLLARSLLARADGSASVSGFAGKSMLEELQSQGFSIWRCDASVSDGGGLVLLGGAGRFWSLRDDQTVPVESASNFIRFQQPNYVRVATHLEARAVPSGTLLTTETRVAGTDRNATRQFKRYWRLIAPASGLIRRSWLAGIARRAHRNH